MTDRTQEEWQAYIKSLPPEKISKISKILSEIPDEKKNELRGATLTFFASCVASLLIITLAYHVYLYGVSDLSGRTVINAIMIAYMTLNMAGTGRRAVIARWPQRKKTAMAAGLTMVAIVFPLVSMLGFYALMFLCGMWMNLWSYDTEKQNMLRFRSLMKDGSEDEKVVLRTLQKVEIDKLREKEFWQWPKKVIFLMTFFVILYVAGWGLDNLLGKRPLTAKREAAWEISL